MQSLVSYHAALLSLIEVSLGSLLHAFHIPFSGHMLSLNQGLILTQACQKTENQIQAARAANRISIITAILKSLSPMGKRLTPMLAISVQGLLYSFGVGLFGVNIFGVVIAMSLLSLWGFAQPLLLAYLFFGEKLFLAIEKLWMDICEKLSISPEYGIWILVGFVLFKIILSWFVGFIGLKYPQFVQENYLKKLMRYKNLAPSLKKKPASSPWRGAFKDLLNPWLIGSLLLTIGFMSLTEKSDYFTIFVYTLRVFAVALIFFWIVRAFPQSWIDKLLIKYPTLKQTVDRVLQEAEPKR